MGIKVQTKVQFVYMYIYVYFLNFSHFGFYNGSFDVVPFNKREIYTSDAIGLKTLADHGKLIIIVRPFVHHLTWHTNKHIIKEVILPHLT